MNIFVVLFLLGCFKVIFIFFVFKMVVFIVVICGGWLLFRVNLIVGEGLLVIVLVLIGVKILGIFLIGILLLFGDNIFGLVVSILLI